MQHSRTVDGLHNKPEKPDQQILEKIAVAFQQLRSLITLEKHRPKVVSMKYSSLVTYMHYHSYAWLYIYIYSYSYTLYAGHGQSKAS